MNFREFINLFESSNFRVISEKDPHQHNAGFLRAYLGVKEVGVLHWYAENRYKSIHIESVVTVPEFRGHGVAKRLVQELVNLVRRDYKWVNYITGDLMSKKTLSIRNSVFGRPEYLGSDFEEFTNDIEKAAKILPLDAKENDDGSLDGNKVFIKSKVSRHIGKKKLQKFKPFITQPDLPWKDKI